jgi:hypothetical protein
MRRGGGCRFQEPANSLRALQLVNPLVPSPEHKYVAQNSGLTEIDVRFVRPILILM